MYDSVGDYARMMNQPRLRTREVSKEAAMSNPSFTLQQLYEDKFPEAPVGVYARMMNQT